jgi:hypothetical protein
VRVPCRWYATQAIPLVFIGGLVAFVAADLARVRGKWCCLRGKWCCLPGKWCGLRGKWCRLCLACFIFLLVLFECLGAAMFCYRRCGVDTRDGAVECPRVWQGTSSVSCFCCTRLVYACASTLMIQVWVWFFVAQQRRLCKDIRHLLWYMHPGAVLFVPHGG